MMKRLFFFSWAGKEKKIIELHEIAIKLGF